MNTTDRTSNTPLNTPLITALHASTQHPNALHTFVFLTTVFLTCPLEGREVPFAGSIVDSDILGVQGLDAADVDGDGDLDILAAARGNTGKIFWAENTASDGSAWTLHEVDANFALAFSAAGGDFDHDGDIDIVGVANQDSDVAWWENTAGDGSAWSRHDIETSYLAAEAVAVGDVNGDGHLDVLAAASFGNEVTWFENTAGTGLSWTEHTVSNTFKGSRAIYGADFDADGDLDLLAAGGLGDIVAWFENTAGDGSTWSQQTLETNFDGGIGVHAADIDGDGDIDALAVAEFDDEITWYENNGGSFSTHVIDNTFDGAASVFAADLDDDGDTDVLGAANNGNHITWFENTAGDGSTWTKRTIAGSFSTPRFTAAADFDKDGDLDVYASSVNLREISWWQNETIHRSATQPAEEVLQGDLDGARAVVADDFDGDGDRDLAAIAFDADEVAWWENTLGDASTFTKHTASSTSDGPRSLASLDIDRDGDRDLLVAAENDDDISWWQNGGTGTFVKNAVATVLAVRQASAADIDGDGAPDVLSASAMETEIAWFKNDGSGGTWTETIVDGAYPDAQSVAGADLDGDGDQDIVAVAGAPTGIVTWWENTAGNGLSWSSAQSIDASYSAASYVATADLDGDGDQDVLGAGGGSPGILTWWENSSGDGSTWVEHDISCPACAEALDDPLFILATDLDDDGDPDILGTGSIDGGRLHWYENANGDGLTWILHEVTSAFLGAAGAAAADLDHDGDVDLLATASADDDLSYWQNRGGQFALPTTDLGATLGDSVTEAVLRITATHRGRSGDADVELTALELLFEETVGTPLTTAAANNILEELSIYRDTGDQSFDSGADTLVALVDPLDLTAGSQTVPFLDGDAMVQIAHGTPVDFFVVLETSATYTTGPLASLLVTHVTEASSTADDTDHDIPLLLEFSTSVASGPIPANPAAADADLSISLSDSADPVQAGAPYSYTIAVTNHGPGVAHDVAIATALTGPVSFTSTAGGCSEDPGGVPACSLGALAASQTVNITVEVAADDGTAGTATADVSVTTSGTDPNPANNAATENTEVQLVADLVVENYVALTHFVAGDTITYRVFVTNEGPLDAPGTSIDDAFPPEVTGITWTCVGSGGATCGNVNGSGDLVAEMVNLPAGSMVKFEATGTATGTSDFTATATATVAAGLTDPAANSSDDAPSVAVAELTFVGDFEEGDFSDWNQVVMN